MLVMMMSVVGGPVSAMDKGGSNSGLRQEDDNPVGVPDTQLFLVGCVFWQATGVQDIKLKLYKNILC